MKIIASLKRKPKTVSELSKSLSTEQSKLSHALALLRHCSIVDVEIYGKNRIYYLNKKTILPILNIVDKHRSKNCKVCSAMKYSKCMNASGNEC